MDGWRAERLPGGQRLKGCDGWGKAFPGSPCHRMPQLSPTPQCDRWGWAGVVFSLSLRMSLSISGCVSAMAPGHVVKWDGGLTTSGGPPFPLGAWTLTVSAYLEGI